MRAKEAGMLLLFVSAFTALAETREFNGLTFVADGDAATYAWDSENRTLTLTGAGPYFLTGTNTVELGATWIVSSSSAGATLSISNLVMAAPRLRSTLTVTSGTSLHIFVAGTNSISSTGAGILVPSSASLAISRAPGFLNDNAVLTVTGSDGAGIGGEKNSPNGAITIHGGTVTANAGNGAGIGTGGFGNAQSGTYACGDITIDGGRVYAYGSGRGAGIGGGAYVNWQGTIRISGGVVRARGAFCGIGTGFPAYSVTTDMTTFITGGNVVSEYNEAWSGSGRQVWVQGIIRTENNNTSGSRHEFTGFEPWQRVVVKNVSDAFGSRDLTANEDGVVWLWTTAYGRSVVPAEPVGVTAEEAVDRPAATRRRPRSLFHTRGSNASLLILPSTGTTTNFSATRWRPMGARCGNATSRTLIPRIVIATLWQALSSRTAYRGCMCSGAEARIGHTAFSV